MSSSSTAPCSVIIVTYNSQKFISKAMEALSKQTRRPEKIILVDTGSKNLSYLQPFLHDSSIQLVIGGKEIGFCRGNNIGMGHIASTSRYVLFLNPDAFLPPDFLHKAISFLDQPAQQDIGIFTTTLLGYDIDKDAPTGKYDSRGIYRTWYGRWYDKDQREPIKKERVGKEESPDAICGALMLCRLKALKDVMLSGEEIFDSRFFMYKEDIDLSLRVKEKGWRLSLAPWFTAYHCRGWQPDRSKIDRRYRLFSARNELRINGRTLSLPMAYSACKYAAVKLLNW